MVLCLLITILFSNFICAQTDSIKSSLIDIYIIDSYITPEEPYKFVLSFYTSDSCKSKIVIDNKELSVASDFVNNHKIEIDLKGIVNNKNTIKYKVVVIDKNNAQNESQYYEVEVPQNILLTYKKDTGLLQVCCFGGVFFGLPSPTLVLQNNKRYLSITKEIPLFSFYSRSYNYPFGYIGIEYAHIFDYDKQNFFRFGYKQIVQLNFIKYISIGINHFTDFKGYNGLSPELSMGLFQIQNVFTVYIRYRYNFQTVRKGTDFHEVSIGLYSNFYSINF